MEDANHRIARNSALLYIRMLIVMIINLYMVRVVLNALGAEDYGIYNVVAGVITMLSCVTSVLSTSTNRFFSFYLGTKESFKLKETYTCSLIIFISISIIILIIGETLGIWFVTNKLVIPGERLNAAKWIFHFSVFAFIFTILQTPYSSMITAHEDMGYYAIISSVECVLRLLCAYFISSVRIDKLVYYGLYLMLVSLFSLVSYYFISKRKYSECICIRIKDHSLYKSIISFSGWTLFGSVAGVGLNQIVSILLNIFHGPLANAARGIATQIYAAIFTFSNSFLLAVKPALIKSYADSNFVNVNRLFNISNKVVLYLLLCICLPIIFRMDSVLSLWLNSSDSQTVLFSQLMVVYAVIMAESSPITYVVQATGKIKQYHIYVELFTLLCPAIVLALFKKGYPAYTAFVAMIVCLILSHIVRIICLKRIYSYFKVKEYLLNFVGSGLIVTSISTLLLFFINNRLNDSILSLFVLIVISVVVVLSLGYLIGFTKEERTGLNTVVLRFIRKAH